MAIVLHDSPTDASLAPHLFPAEPGVSCSLASVDRSTLAQRSVAEAKASGPLDLVGSQLGTRAGPWLLGEPFSATGAFLRVRGGWTRRFARRAGHRRRVGALLERATDRPAARAGFSAEGIDRTQWLPRAAASSFERA